MHVIQIYFQWHFPVPLHPRSLLGGRALVYCAMLFKYHLTRCMFCTLNCASNWPADISWQAGEDTDLLNTWHSAARSKCKIKRAFWRKRKLQSHTTSAELAWSGDGWGPETHAFLSSSPPLSVKAALLLLTPGLVTCPLPVSHGSGGGSTGQACCFSPGRQWVPGFLLWSTAMMCCKPQHIT